MSELADVVGWMMPGLMRVFASGVISSNTRHRGPEDEPGAAQATITLTRFSRGMRRLSHIVGGIYDALLTGNGILKYWWDDAVYSGGRMARRTRPEAVIALVLSDDDVEVIGHKVMASRARTMRVGSDGQSENPPR